MKKHPDLFVIVAIDHKPEHEAEGSIPVLRNAVSDFAFSRKRLSQLHSLTRSDTAGVCTHMPYCTSERNGKRQT